MNGNVWLFLAADRIQHLAVGGHGLAQILHHRHCSDTSCDKVVGIRPTYSGQPFGQHHNCCVLQTEQAAHLADGLHAADQVLLHIHNQYLLK